MSSGRDHFYAFKQSKHLEWPAFLGPHSLDSEQRLEPVRHNDGGFAYTLDDTAHVELKLWRPGSANNPQSRPHESGSSWTVHTLQNIIQHCATGKLAGGA
eukprot:1881812-Amphidinium_carterae.1